MSVEGKQMVDVIVTDTDNRGNRYKVVDISGTIAANANAAYGIVATGVNSGHHESVAWFGHMKGYAGAAVTIGAKLTVTTSGYLIVNATSGATTVGRARVAANSGDLFDLIGNFANAGTDGGV